MWPTQYLIREMKRSVVEEGGDGYIPQLCIYFYCVVSKHHNSKST